MKNKSFMCFTTKDKFSQWLSANIKNIIKIEFNDLKIPAEGSGYVDFNYQLAKGKKEV